MNDVISRQAVIEALHRYFDGMLETDTWSPCDVYGLIEILPSAQPELIEREAYIRGFEQGKTQGRLDTLSAQPELPEWAQKVEEYRKSAPSHIHNPLAWALYQAWKEYDR